MRPARLLGCIVDAARVHDVIDAHRAIDAKEAIKRLLALEHVARLIDGRFEGGSLQADSAEDHGPDDPEPIQHQLRRALAALDEVR